MDDQPGNLYLPPDERRVPAGDREPALPGVAPGRVEERPAPSAEPPREQPPPAPPPRRSGARRAIGWLLLLLIIGGVVAWVILRSGHQTQPVGRVQSSGPMPVGTATVTKGDMPVVYTGLGTVTPLATVTVKTQINGQLTEVAFNEGQVVNKGDFLAQIDPRPYQVALEQAQGQLAKDQAALKNAQVDLQRYRTLVAQNSIARQTLDTQAATVQQDVGAVQADQAQVDAQKLNLTYCRIIAPVGGRVGLRQVDPGNYVQTSDANGIVVITQIQPISVIFTLSEDSLPTVIKQLQAGAKLQATAYDRTNAVKLETGTLETIDNQIDPTTGTIRLRATFANPGQQLFPQQFVNIRLLVDTLRGVPLIPTAAVQRGAPGTFVYLVQSNGTVKAQPVTLGPGTGETVAVTKGLQVGQQVVTDGADRLKDGAKVKLTEKTTAEGVVAPAASGAEPAPPSGQAPAPGPGKQASPATGKPRLGQHRGQGRRSPE